ncbi:MAG TPA: ERF family protein [Paenisporosarcina sp.]|nr:ERF family protein [Paenisporosarcina sp.]
MNLHQKLIEVRKDIGGFTKDKKSFNYEYVSGSQVLAKIQSKMNELGILLIPQINEQLFQEHAYKDKHGKDKLDFIVYGSMSYTWVNADDPEDKIIIPFYYTGQQDDISKAFGSGLTYSERYFIIKFFNLPTDADDPDAKDTTGRSGNNTKYTPAPKQQTQTNQAPAQTSGVKMISDPQVKLVKTKLGVINKKTGEDQAQIYKKAQDHLNIHKSTKELTSSDASKVINYLATLE